ncbi:hypothetical protein ASPVEDRAFT_196792 [Aspergillus versicolor CBS 583.65]|uniref:Trichothecene 3-O-acetyltransferase-like N-terminal domain-containing protein n=1 Tax=Aspergillus versicolor CBS 583.65 TaxID=1036611 RepID=A0A1L9PSJ2_ASPVE|nr:uncharacterized protein ASPVEDRAFT_196792 [Aspergillus versicolor CBS 583.65]OJJ04406.1 hypothetical protein ASPVEDRAFT_196792 [Aspergillus versicolor CBS 583.65]
MSADNVISLDTLAQQPRLNRLYTQVTLFFPLRDPASERESINIFKRGSIELSKHFPWTSGTVVLEDGIFKINPSKDASLVVKDYKGGGLGVGLPDYATLKQSQFPFNLLDEALLSPVKTFNEFGTGLPVLLIQVSLVQGGLSLTFNGQHGAMDMAGLGSVMRLFAKGCRGEPFTVTELEIGNTDRRDVLPLLFPLSGQPSNNDETKTRIQQPTATTSNSLPAPGPTLVWAYFSFSTPSLTALKSSATARPEKGLSQTFISTDDALSAFVWQSITRARSQNKDQSPLLRPSTLSRNVDVRRHFSLPDSYPGFMTSATSHTFLVEKILAEPLGSIALSLRRALDPIALKDKTLAQALLIIEKINSDRDGGMPSKAESGTVLPGNPALDVRLSSWAKEELNGLDFGSVLGKPEAIRRPSFGPGSREGLVYFLPRGLDGSIVVGICLKGEDMERLKMDAEVKKYAAYIG